LKKKDRRGWRSPRLYPEERRAPPRRALQSPVYIRKKAAANKERKEKRKNFKELNSNGRSGCYQLDCSSCPKRPLKKQSIKLVTI